MAWTAVTDETEIGRAFATLQRTFSSGARFFPNHDVGWPGGHGRFDVHWHAPAQIWGTFQVDPPASKERQTPCFWNCFGVQSPERFPSLSITVEINPPHRGLGRRLGGAFISDDSGQVYLAHSGRIGGGKKGVGPRAFLEWYDSPDLAFIAQRGSPMLVIGRIDAPDLISRLRLYVSNVAEFKETVGR